MHDVDDPLPPQLKHKVVTDILHKPQFLLLRRDRCPFCHNVVVPANPRPSSPLEGGGVN